MRIGIHGQQTMGFGVHEIAMKDIFLKLFAMMRVIYVEILYIDR